MKHILVTARGLRLHIIAASTWAALDQAQALYPHRAGFSARVIPTATAIANQGTAA
jgi:hypothetical protein